jgi:hypothetical protein
VISYTSLENFLDALRPRYRGPLTSTTRLPIIGREIPTSLKPFQASLDITWVTFSSSRRDVLTACLRRQWHCVARGSASVSSERPLRDQHNADVWKR